MESHDVSGQDLRASRKRTVKGSVVIMASEDVIFELIFSGKPAFSNAVTPHCGTGNPRFRVLLSYVTLQLSLTTERSDVATFNVAKYQICVTVQDRFSPSTKSVLHVQDGEA